MSQTGRKGRRVLTERNDGRDEEEQEQVQHRRRHCGDRERGRGEEAAHLVEETRAHVSPHRRH